ncbi:MAG: nitrilase-related carbon-nitrogen hydrolase [Ilumatobacteraceae bacterium]
MTRIAARTTRSSSPVRTARCTATARSTRSRTAARSARSVPARSSSPFEIDGLRVTPFVCYDLRFADEFWATAHDTDLYLVPANWPAARRAHWRSLLVARAIENQAYVVGRQPGRLGRWPRLHRRQPDHRSARRGARRRSADRVDRARRRRPGNGRRGAHALPVPR